MVVVANSTVKKADVAPVMKGYVNDTGEEPLPVPSGWVELPVSWLLSGEEEQFEFHVSIFDEAISLTSAGRSGWMRCLLHTAVCEWQQGVVARPPSRQEVDSECPGDASLGFHSCLLELLLHWKSHTHTSRAALRPGTAAVVKMSAGLDCVAVSPLGSAAMPGSASFSPHTTA